MQANEALSLLGKVSPTIVTASLISDEVRHSHKLDIQDHRSFLGLEYVFSQLDVSVG